MLWIMKRKCLLGLMVFQTDVAAVQAYSTTLTMHTYSLMENS